MEFDLMVGPLTWSAAGELAANVERAGFSGMLFTETSQTPWMSIATAAQAAPSLTFTTGIAVAFPRSPMVSAALAWELAENTGGRFRLGLGSQVKAHVERRYGVAYEPVGPRMKDYLLAVRACLRAFGGEKLAYDGEHYKLTLLPRDWAPRRHAFGDIGVDVSAVGPWMTRMAGEVADGIHVHPLHSVHYLEQRLLPSVAEGAARAGRDPSAVDLIVPVFAAPGDTPEERAPLVARARRQVGFYGSTKNYAFQFDDLGFEGLSAKLNDALKQGDMATMADLVTDEVLDHFAVVCPWEELAPRLLERYRGRAARVVMYLAEDSLRTDPASLPKWGRVAEAVRAG